MEYSPLRESSPRWKDLESLVTTLESVADKEEWSHLPRVEAEELLHNATQFTASLLSPLDPSTAEKISRCRSKILQRCGERESGLEKLQGMIATREKLAKIKTTMMELHCSEEEHILFVEKIIDGCDEVTACSEIGRLEQLFLDPFFLSTERARREIAFGIAKRGEGFALSLLMDQLTSLNFVENDRLIIANILAERKNYVRVFNSKIHPLQFVINNLATFVLPERERLRLAHRFLDQAKEQERVLCISQFDKIAPRALEDRLIFLDRFLQEGEKLTLEALARYIATFHLPQKELHRVMELIVERKFFEVVAVNLDGFGLSQSKLREIIFLIAREGCDIALSRLMKMNEMERWELSKEEKRSLASLFFDRGGEFTLPVMTSKIPCFDLADGGERLDFALELLAQKKRAPRLIDSLIRHIHDVSLQGKGREEEKLYLLKELIEGSSAGGFLDLLLSIKEFLFLFEGEEFRLRFICQLARRVNCDQLYNYTKAVQTSLLSEKGRLTSLEALMESKNPSIFREVGHYLVNFHLSHHSPLAMRLRIAITLATLGDEKARQNLSYNLHHLHLDERQASPHVMREQVNSMDLLHRLPLSLETLDLLPDIFPEIICFSFQGQINQVRKILATKTKVENRSQVAQQLISLLLYAMEKVRSGEMTQEAVLELTSLAQALFDYRNPEKRDVLFLKIVDEMGKESHLEMRREWSALVEKIRHPAVILPLFVLFLSREEELVHSFLDRLEKERRFLKDGAKQDGLILFLFEALKVEGLQGRELYRWLHLCFSPKEPHEKYTTMRKMHDLLAYGLVEKMKLINSLQAIDQLLEELFTDAFDLQGISSFPEKYERSVGRFRDNHLLLSYGVTLNATLREKYGLYVRSILEGTFQRIRYQREGNLHLTTLFHGREELARRWIIGESLRGDELLPVDYDEGEGTSFNLLTFLQDRLVHHHHLGLGEDDRFSYLLQGLSCGEEERRSVIQSLQQRMQGEDGKQELFVFQEILLNLTLQSPSKELFLQGVKALPQGIIEGTPFAEDLRALQAVSRAKIEASKVTVSDTDDPNDLLLMGTEIYGSCQTILHGATGHNICLLAYLLDGKHRIIAVKDSAGRLIGRCVLRMVLSDQKPVLFRERFYVNHGDAMVRKLLEMMALRRAQTLALPLLTEGEGVPFKKRVYSLGGAAPYEYVDAMTESGEHMVADGIYSLKTPTLLYMPSSSIH